MWRFISILYTKITSHCSFLEFSKRILRDDINEWLQNSWYDVYIYVYLTLFIETAGKLTEYWLFEQW